MNVRNFKSKLEQLLGDEHPEDVMEFLTYAVVLTTGDTLITSIGEIDADNYCLLHPYKLRPMATNDGSVVMTIVNYVPGSSDTFFHLPANLVATIGTLDESMFELYVRAVEKDMAMTEESAAAKSENSGTVIQFPGTKNLH